MPQSVVPKTPIPVHTAYTVPIGSVFAAKDINRKLSNSASMVGIVGRIFVNPSEYLNPMGHAISSAPAASRYNQAILNLYIFSYLEAGPSIDLLGFCKAIGECMANVAISRIS
jgi:hypothetical protein